MKISELSKDALNQWIAWRLEPMPEHFAQANGEVSPHGGWVSYWKGQRWNPRDFCTDSACTVMLEEELLHRINEYEMILSDSHGHDRFVEIELCHATKQNYLIQASSLGRGAAEAWALANGWAE